MHVRCPSILAAGALAGCLLLSGCNGSTSKTATAVPRSTSGATAAAAGAGAAATNSDPCSLLTQSEAETAVGVKLNPAQNTGAAECQWSTSDFTSDVDLTLGTWDSIKGAATAGSTQPTAVSGVGDEALNLNGSNGSLLYVRKGDNGFLLSINGPNVDGLADHGLAQEQVLATAVLGRM